MSQEAAFWDSSALIPLCIQEETSKQAKTLAEQFAPVVWWATPIEIHSAFARLQRSGQLDRSGEEAALERLLVLSKGWREIIPGDRLRAQAETLLHAYPLRAADSMQLAAGLSWCQQRPARRTFISADARLLEAASRAGFAVVRLGTAAS